jgi:hypothetical protein
VALERVRLDVEVRHPLRRGLDLPVGPHATPQRITGSSGRRSQRLAAPSMPSSATSVKTGMRRSCSARSSGPATLSSLIGQPWVFGQMRAARTPKLQHLRDQLIGRRDLVRVMRHQHPLGDEPGSSPDLVQQLAVAVVLMVLDAEALIHERCADAVVGVVAGEVARVPDLSGCGAERQPTIALPSKKRRRGMMRLLSLIINRTRGAFVPTTAHSTAGLLKRRLQAAARGALPAVLRAGTVAAPRQVQRRPSSMPSAAISRLVSPSVGEMTRGWFCVASSSIASQRRHEFRGVVREGRRLLGIEAADDGVAVKRLGVRGRDR